MKSLTIILLLLVSISVSAQELVVYKQIDTTSLNLEVYRPSSYDATQTYPAMVFFFGGGWTGGSRGQFRPHAQALSQLGIVCFLADYRIAKVHHTTPFESLKDAKSAIRFIRAHADEYHLNPNQIIASGGSAGGHLAAATTLCTGYDEATDDLAVSCKANALVLFNGVIDNGPGGYGYGRIGDAYKQFSPLHNITKAAPPTLLLLGDKDHLIPVTTYEYYKVVMDKVKVQCELHVYEGGKHGFFNYNEEKPEFYNQTMAQTVDFLKSLDYIAKEN